ncbi:MAG: catechol 1,2-dioxygenase [Bacteriovoracaceae bacterium]|nr:catechol 1,2-dioxygenase [Bacteriovoracaceae bacterium]
MEYTVKTLLKEVNSSYKHPGDERIRAISEHLIEQMYNTIVKFDVSHDEMWAFLKWMNELGKANQAGLLAAGLGIERLLDILADEKEKQKGITTGTARAIEGPLYVPGAPLEKKFARIDDGTQKGEVLIMEGDVFGPNGERIPHALVEVWLADQEGTYSIINPAQTPYNNRRKIEADEKGHYGFRTLVPPGYSVPKDSPTQKVLDLLGREGNRPAHIHFMVSAPGYEQLTTQINMPGDKYIDEDFAFATRDPLIVTVEKVNDPKMLAQYDLKEPYAHIKFNFTLHQG